MPWGSGNDCSRQWELWGAFHFEGAKNSFSETKYAAGMTLCYIVAKLHAAGMTPCYIVANLLVVRPEDTALVSCLTSVF